MKKIISIITICTILLSLLTGCGNSDKESNRKNDSNEKNIQSTIIEDETMNTMDKEYSLDDTVTQPSQEIYDSSTINNSLDDNAEYNQKANSSSDFSYEDNGEEEIRIVRYNGISANVIVPSKIENKLVTEIGDSAFKDLAGLQTVELPSTLKSIGEYAFYNCVGLNSIILKEGIQIIKKASFKNCENMQEINLPTTLQEIESEAFFECRKLKCIEIPDNVTSFGTPTDSYQGGCVFFGCENLTSVKLSESQYCIPIDSFKDCVNLTDIVIPNSVRTLEEGAFENCTSLKEITIPGSVSEINYPGLGSFPAGPFDGCSSLEKVIFEEGELKIISYGMFGGCVSLKEVVMPDNIIEIDKFAFNGCINLGNIEFSPQLKALGYNCFKDCEKLSTIVIPNTCINIGEGAFSGCTNLSSVILPENVQSMSVSAFYGCALKEIIIPNNVTDFSFYGCEYLKNITVKGLNTKLDASYWSGSDFDGLTIIAPSGSEAETFAKEHGINFSILN